MVEHHEIGAGGQSITVDRLPIVAPINRIGRLWREVAKIQMRIGSRRKTEICSVEAPDAELATGPVAAIPRVSGEPTLTLKREAQTCVEIHELVSASLVTSNA